MVWNYPDHKLVIKIYKIMKYKNKREQIELWMGGYESYFPKQIRESYKKLREQLLATQPQPIKEESKWVGKFAPNGGHDPNNPFPLKQEDNKECTCEQYYIPDNCPIHGINRKTNPLIEKCPNCIEQDENIKSMPDGSCGVCGGKGYIEWKKVGKLINKQEESKDIEKLEFSTKFVDMYPVSFMEQLWKKQCEVIDTINSLTKRNIK